MGDRLRAGKSSGYATSQLVDSAFHPSGVGKMKISFGWKGKPWFMPLADKRMSVPVTL